MAAAARPLHTALRLTLRKRALITPGRSWAIRGGAVVIALVLAAALLSLTGKNPLTVYQTMFRGAFASKFGLSETLVRMTPLLLCGLGIALASRMGLWNIGAEGQFHLGAIAATWVAMHDKNVTPWALLPAMAIAGALFGGLWCLIPALARAYLGTSEIITTLMLNYVGIDLMLYLVHGAWKDPGSLGFPLTPEYTANATLPLLWGRLHAGFFVALLLAALMFWLLRYTRWGYTVRVVGESPTAARYAGLDIARNMLLVMFIAGALAGLAGMMEISGLIHRLQASISPGYGYTAIIIAYLAQLNPIALVVVSFLFGGLQVGGYSIQTLNIPVAGVNLIQGVILFCVLGAELFTRYEISLRRVAVGEEA